MSSQLSVVYLVKNPPISVLAAQVEYMRELADEFCFAVDDRTDQKYIDLIQSWPGTKLTMIKWRDDFSWARNQALNLVTRPWTLHLDPDELPSIKAMKHIEWAIDPNRVGKEVGFVYWFRNWWGGERGEEMPYHYHTRLWRSGRGEWYRPVHELVMLDGHGEDVTRGTYKAPLVDPAAYFIHSKPAEAIAEADKLYNSIEKGHDNK